MITYPSSSVWYIRVSTDSKTGEGSGVGIRLRSKNEPGTEVTYILTCAHVVRQPRNNNEFGPIHENILVYRAGDGYDESNGIQVEPFTWVTPLNTFAVGSFYNQPVEDIENADWVLLAFIKPKWSKLSEEKYLALYRQLSDLQIGDQCQISGYPGGKSGFAGLEDGKDNIVRPKSGYGLLTIENVVDDIITLVGTQSRSGMSGGGVFIENGKKSILCGLHRARNDETMQLKAVSIEAISRRLDELGYELVGDQDHVNSPNEYIVGYLVSVFGVACLSLMISYWIFPTEAWRLQFSYYLNYTLPLGIWFESLLTFFLAICFYILIQTSLHSELSVLIKAIKNKTFRNKIKWPIFITLFITILIATATIYSSIDYLLREAPDNLKVWAENKLKGNIDDIPVIHLNNLRKELINNPIKLYEIQYLCYLPYALCNFIFLAQPFLALFLFATCYHIDLLLKAKNRLRITPLDKINMQFAEFNKSCYDAVNHLIHSLCFFSGITVFYLAFNNLTDFASYTTEFAIFTIMLPAWVGLIVCYLIYSNEFNNTMSEIEKISTDPRKIDDFKKRKLNPYDFFVNIPFFISLTASSLVLLRLYNII